MFVVQVIYSMLGVDWEEVDSSLETLASRASDFAGAICFNGTKERYHGWLVPTFADAQELRKRLSEQPDTVITIREK